MACLSSRIPYGEAVTPGKLDMIERAENVLRDLGFHDVRVRHHETGPRGEGRGAKLDTLMGQAELRTSRLPPPTSQHLARIEVGPSEIARLVAPENASHIADALKQIGYAHVTVDLQGYRRGSLNESVGNRTPKTAQTLSTPPLSRRNFLPLTV
jgi:uncharacterized protein